jgi:ribonucleotide monophosphatase NagD (HAD superfamily)
VVATIVGKPQPQLFASALDRMGEGRTLAIGDRLDADVAAAAAAGIDAALVLSGGDDPSPEDLEREPVPVQVASNLRELVIQG